MDAANIEQQVEALFWPIWDNIVRANPLHLAVVAAEIDIVTEIKRIIRQGLVEEATPQEIGDRVASTFSTDDWRDKVSTEKNTHGTV